jgi:hypothetical protein
MNEILEKVPESHRDLLKAPLTASLSNPHPTCRALAAPAK